MCHMGDLLQFLAEFLGCSRCFTGAECFSRLVTPHYFFWNQPAFPMILHTFQQFSHVCFFHDTVFDFGETTMLRNHRSWFRRRAVLSLHVLLSQCCYVGLQTSSFTVLRRSKMVSAELSSPVEHQRTLQSQTYVAKAGEVLIKNDKQKSLDLSRWLAPNRYSICIYI